MEPKVSIIVATYRREDPLKRALLSIGGQTYKNIEVIVVDDNAEKYWNDRVEKVIQEIKLPFVIKYIKNNKNLGSAETRNVGIRKSTGVYITFLDDDDLYLEDKVKKQVEHMIDENSDFSVTDLKLYSENEKLIEVRKRNYIKKTDKKNLLMYHLKYHITGTDTMMFKSSYLKSIGGFEPIDIGDEFYLIKKAIDKDGKFSYLERCDVKAYVHIESEGLSSGKSKIQGENLLYEYKKIFFGELKYSDRRYIRMRHYAVLAFAEYRRKKFINFIYYSLKSFLIDPISLVNIYIYRK